MITRSWRAWLADGRVFDSAQHSWSQVPFVVVGVVEYYDPPYRDLHHNHDWICLDATGFHRVPMHPVPGRWAEKPEGVDEDALKQGMTLPDEVWADIYQEMIDAREAP